MSEWDKRAERIERRLEAFLFWSRWLLAPFFVGLSLVLLVLLVKFVREVGHVFSLAFKGSEADVILGVLSLVDLTLTGALLIIVIFAGYENFVSRIDHDKHDDWPEWMGTIDFTALKIKLLSSIVAISAIQLLKTFMNVKNTSDRELLWQVIIHGVFVASSVLLALSDRIAGHNSSRHDGGSKGQSRAPRTPAPPTPAVESKPGGTAPT